MPQEFRAEAGPFVIAVNNALSDLRVERQAYHSRTFIGNHVHKCCQVGMQVSTFMLSTYTGNAVRNLHVHC